MRYLGRSDGRFARFIISLRLLAGRIQFRADAIHLLHGPRQICVYLFLFRLPFRGQHRLGRRQFFALAVSRVALGAGAVVKFRPQLARIGIHLGNPVAALVVDGPQFRFLGFDLLVQLQSKRV